jgi:hypothetical protein
MSSIRIECRKDKFDADDTKDYKNYKKQNSLGDELVIESNQINETFFQAIDIADWH